MHFKPFLFLFTLLFYQQAFTQNVIFKNHKTVYKIGDELNWSSKDLDESDWTSQRPILQDGRILWYRLNIELLEEPKSLLQYGIQLEAYGEYEIFWDGVMIGKNGNPGQETERPPEGTLWTTYGIPRELSGKGTHVLALRASLLHFPDHTEIHSLKIDYYDELIKNALIENTYMHVYAGAFLIVSLYFLFLFISHKKAYATLIFSICCFLVFALTMTVFSNSYIPLHYSLHVIRLHFLSTFLLGITFLIPFYFSQQFPYPRRNLSLTLYTGVLFFIFLVKHHAFDFKAVSMVLSMWIFSFGIVAHGIYKQMRGARLVLAILLLSMAILLATGFIVSLYAGLGLILLSMLYLLALQIKAERLAYEHSLIQSTRLQLELLKKNIQPHFLLNTLTSLIDWVEEAPQKGVLFIEALAKEFDLINQVEDKTLISIVQEIDLCKSHLDIMSYRKEIDYSWEDEGIEIKQTIPPAIIHTLLENGITHSIPLENNRIRFKLLFEQNIEYKTYQFLTYAKKAKKSTYETTEGTGLKYVKARLTESYGDQWEFSSKPMDQGWVNTIKIYC